MAVPPASLPSALWPIHIACPPCPTRLRPLRTTGSIQTHISFGVVTAGVYASRWKAEMSVFNGREPDDKRTNVDFGALDSFSGRLWLLPTSKLVLQVSAGKLTEAEASGEGGPGLDVTRATASVTYHSAFRDNTIWA